MSERLEDSVPQAFGFEEATTPQAPQFISTARELGGAIVPFGFDATHAAEITEDGSPSGELELRTNSKTREDTTSSEHLPF
jgi:hypothetical protein